METKERLRLFKIHEVCEMLNLSRSAVYRLSNSGELPSVRIGKSVRVTGEAIDSFVKSLTSIDRYIDSLSHPAEVA